MLAKHLAACHKETQTSNTSTKDSSSGTLCGSDICDKGSIKIIEFNELIQDPNRPNDITIIKDVFLEEIHTHSGSPSDDATSNRYTYCREVIKPYLKDYPNDCPISDNQLIRDALAAAHQDFPDYQPCFGINDVDKDIVDKKDSSKSSNLDKDKKDSSKTDLADSGKITNSPKPCVSCKKNKSNTSNTSILDKEKRTDSSTQTCVKKKDSNETPKTCTIICKKKKRDASKTSIKTKESSDYNFKSKMDDKKDEECPNKPRDPRCQKKDRSHQPLRCPPSVESDICRAQGGPSPGPPSACKNKAGGTAKSCKNTPSVGSCKEEKQPTTTTSKKSKENDKPCKHSMSITELNRKCSSLNETPVIPSEEKPKTILAAHCETITTIKSAVEDFFGKVYQTTKEAVTIIKTESARHLGKISSKKSGSTCDGLPPHEVHDKKNSESVTGFNLFKNIDDPKFEDGVNNKVSGSLSTTTEMVVGTIITKVGSTISTFSDHVDFDKVASLMRVKDLSNTSSPYDKGPPSPKSPNAGSSVFTVIKSKIASMFGEGESETKEYLSKKTSISSETVTADTETADDEELNKILRQYK